MQRSSGCFRTLFYALVFFFLYPLVSLAALTVQIKTVPDQAVLPLEVEFEAVVTGGTAPYSYVWGFGDGGTSSLVKDSHYYREAGQYNVYLMVVDDTGANTFASKTVTVSSDIFNPEDAVFTVYSDTSHITSMVQDINDSSILWVGTDGGLVRLDMLTGEKKFYLNELPDLGIQDVIQSSDSAIWIGTYGGFARFDYEKDQWTIFNTDNSGLPHNLVRSLLQTSDDAIWVGTWDGLARFDYENNQWTVFNTDNSGLPRIDDIFSLLQTSDRAIWVGTWDGLARFDYENNQWTVFNADNSGLPHNDVISLLETSDGAIWLVAYGGGLSRFDYEKNQWTVFNTDNSGLPDNYISSLLQTSDGAIWADLARFDYEKNQWTVFNTDNSGLSFDYGIESLLQTSDSAIWIGGWGGLARFDYEKNQWAVFDTDNCGLPDNYISSLLQTSDGSVWIGTREGGLVQFDYEKEQWAAFNMYNSELPNDGILSISQSSDEAMWVGVGSEWNKWNNVARFDYENDQWTVFNTNNSGLPYGLINAILQTSDDALWIGTGEGLARFDYENNQWTVFNSYESGLPDIDIRSFLQAFDGALWVGTRWGGLVRFDYENDQCTVFDCYNSEIPDDLVSAILQTSDGALWIGTRYGLARFDYEKDRWIVFNIDNSGLPDNLIESLVQTFDGAIWVGTYGDGLARFDYEKNQWTVFGADNSGLSSNYIISIMETSDGTIWAGTGRGLNRISFPSSDKSPGHLILLAGGGAAPTNPLWKTTKELATSVYRIFNSRGFKNTDIFFMSPEKWNDFNGDGYDDHIVDRPRSDEDRNLTVADLHYAITDWAVKTYTPGTPLYLYIIDHGYADDGIKGPSFMISPGEILYADDLNAMLNTYETETGGQVIVINESCYSGAFMSRVKKPGRIVITSASDHIVNYDNFGTNSFSHHFLRYLFENSTIQQAFAKSVRRLQESNLTFYQTPQLDDNGDGKYDTNDGMLTASIRLGGDFATGAPWPEILSLEKGTLSGTSVSFTLKTNARMKRVWATVQPPNYVPDLSGNYQNIELEFFNLSDNDEDLTYTGSYDKFTEKGQYILTFYIKDQFGNVAQSAPVRIDVNVSAGDVNGDGDVTLADAVLSLKICTGADISGQTVSTGADVNKDQRIGQAEAVYALRKAAGL